MANVSGVSSSSYSGIYGARGANIISGLASGLDTESMIENSVKGYKLKIQNLMNQQTKLSWKQDAYRGIADKLIALREKYTSYASKTNLFSNSFFNNAVKTSTNGKNADKISATGRTSNSVQVNGVKQIATAAKYTVSADALGLQNMGSLTGGTINWDQEAVDVSDVTGSMTIKVGGSVNNTSISLSFAQEDLDKLSGSTPTEKADALAALINEKLKDTTVGDKKGNEYLTAVVKDGAVTFEAKADGAASVGDGVWISSASGSMVETLGIETSSSMPGGDDAAKYKTLSVDKDFSHKVSMSESLSGKEFSVTLDGVTKKITLGDYGKNVSGKDLQDRVMKDLEDGLKENFGSKVSVELKDNKLSFSTNSQNSILKVTSTTGSTLGVGSGLTNYMDTSRTLGQLLGDKMDSLKALEAVGTVTESEEEEGKGTDEAGNSVMKGDDGEWYRVDKDGKRLYGLEINGKTVGTFTEDSALDTVLTTINNSDAGVSASYSKLSNTFTFAAKETGSDSKVEFGEGLAATLFGQAGMNVGKNGLLVDDSGNQVSGIDDQGNTYYVRQLKDGSYVRADEGGLPIPDKNGGYTKVDADDPVIQKARKGYTAGQDAILNVTVDGVNKTLTRSSNVVNLEGLNVTLKGAFNENAFKAGKTSGYFEDTLDGIEEGSEVTFTTKADSDTIVDAIKSFVEDINAIMKETHEAYSTKPLSLSSSSSYEPLSDEDKADMSETEIKNYEEKAKTGLLFGDSDVSRLYSSLRSAISSSGMDVGVLRDMGITTTYSDGVTTLSLNEDKLRDALEKNPDTVRNAFTKTKENGASSNGLMYNIKKITDTYASTSISNYGILVKKAGTRLKSQSLNDNTLQKQIDRLDKEIDNWKLKMSDKIDYYTTQFTRLEQLMSQMNSQSSALSGLMGG